MDPGTYVFGNKPYDVPSQQTSSAWPGYKDWLAHSLNKELFISHVLAREVTGAMVFGETADTAKILDEEFKNARVEREFQFITDRKPPKTHWSCSEPLGDLANIQPQTDFQLLEESENYYLIRALTRTDSTEQIRKHAAFGKVPLLGDSKHGGTRYPLLFLHCLRVVIPALQLSHTVAPPLVYSDLSLLKQPLLLQWLMSVDRRERLYGSDLTTLRLIHDEGTPLRLDLLGGYGCAGWWSENTPTAVELEQLRELMAIRKIHSWRLMHYSGQRQYDKTVVNTIDRESWIGSENAMQLEFRNESGLSCGLFLDQRENRAWVARVAHGKSVLNLFAYTGAFSVAAAMGGASKVTTVDLSKNYMEWSKRNFALNGVAVETHAFHAMDTMAYLKYAKKKSLVFDLIVCDPPSFSRDKKGHTFRVEKDFPELIEAALLVLAPGGSLLFSNNFEKWTSAKWLTELRERYAGKDLEITEKLNFGWDFETLHDRHMKAFLLRKK